MSDCTCRPTPAEYCPAKRPGMSCSLPDGHGVVHAHCVHAIGHTEHRAYDWRDRCHQEITDEDGYLEACNTAATTTRSDPGNRESYPVCTAHQEDLS